MSGWGVVMAVLGVLALGATAWLAGVAGMPLQFVFLDAFILTKLVDMLLAIMIVGVVTVGLTSRTSALNWFGWAAVILGALASAEGALNVWRAGAAVHVTKLEVVAPGISQALFPLALGLAGGAAAALLSQRNLSERRT